MGRLPAAALMGAAIIAFAAPAFAAGQPERVRGEIQSLSGDTLTVKSYEGKPVKLMLDSQTKYNTVVPAKLSDVKQGDFVGVGATGPENNLQALEVLIFPASMRGTGEGHYPWSLSAAVADADRHAGSAAPGAPPVKGSMTNGTVKGSGSSTSKAAPPVHGTMSNGTVTGSGSSHAAPPVKGSMTNGTVASGGGKAGGQKLTISYNDGKQSEISVPPNAPVVRLTPGERSELKPGAKIFALASEGNGNALTAKSIAVGKDGLMPPM
jgi:hypothetical protein